MRRVIKPSPLREGFSLGYLGKSHFIMRWKRAP